MRAWGFTLALAALLGATSPAWADDPPKARQPSAGDLASARNALREGLAQREKGDAAGALGPLQSAWDFVPTPITGFELAKTHLMLGHVLQAHEGFAQVLRIPPSLEESARSQTARDESARLMKEIEPRIPSLKLKLTLPPGATAEVHLDDEKVALTSGAETTRLVEVGPHDIVAKAGDGPEQKVHIEVTEGQVKEIPLAPQWIQPKPQPAVGPGGQIIYVRTTNPLTFVGFGIAAGAMVVAGVGLVVGINGYNDAQDFCGNKYCPPQRPGSVGTKTTSANYSTDFNNAVARYHGGFILFAAAGGTALIFGGIGAVFAARPVKERVTASIPNTSIKVGLDAHGLGGTF
jgi:hypothetical protein